MNIQLQICGILILLILLFFYHGQKRLNLRTEVAFTRCFTGVLISLLLDVGSIVAIVYMDSLPMFFVELLCKLYPVSLIVVVYFSLTYVCADVCYEVGRYKKLTRGYGIFTILSAIAILLAPIDIFYDAAEKDAHTFGISIYITFICAAVLLLSIFYQLIREKNKINPARKKAMWLWIILWTMAAVVQFISDSAMLMIGFAMAIGMMIVYLMLENPMANIDRSTGIYNQNVMLHYVRQLYGEKKNFSILSISFEHTPGNNIITQADLRMRTEIINYLLNVPKAVVFKNVEDELILIFKDEEWAEKGVAEIVKRFSQGFASGDENESSFSQNDRVPNCHYVHVPNANVVDQVGDLFYLLRYTKENSTELSNDRLLRVSQKMVEKMFCEKEVENMIFSAMENDRVEVFYQPIYSTKEQKFTSAEALCRIRDENGNLVPPGAFIPIAEKNGMILRLGEIVFDKVCKFIKENRVEQYGIQYIEVNLSVVQCAYEGLASSFIEIMERHGVSPEYINLEITESASLSAKMTMLENMKVLMNYGVVFSLDDFGTGQCNLNYIVDMPVDIVKFDKDMIRAYFENKKAKYVMDAAMHMIQGMKLEIVSEGIETEKQFETMKELQIAYIQGFYFSKPLPEVEYLEFMNQA
ncbi:MAG: EAL domain-containing protein [Lachnospiraceae bacterium]|nr:EAL domain-containing protein [Lachnospiraceae bacterium]